MVLLLILAMGILLAAGCGGGIIFEDTTEGIGGTGETGDGENGNGNGDNTNPFASIVPVDLSSISNTQSVVITFSETMDTTSLVLGGTMGPESDGGVWSTTTNENDTVTISPTATWTSGIRTLTFTASDLAGNSVASASISKQEATQGVTYGVQVLFVSTGEDGVLCDLKDVCGNPTAAADLGVDYINDGWSAAEIRVSEGNYEVNSSGLAPGVPGEVRVSAGVSLSGGYAVVDGEPDWTGTRDPVTNITAITDTAAGGGDVPFQPNCPVYALAGVTADSVIDGFRIVGAGGLMSCGIFSNNASPTISNNNIYGGDATTITAAVLNMFNSSPVLQNNTIVGGGALVGTLNTMGIRNFSACSPNIQGNNINAGLGINGSVGIANFTASSPLIDNNDIDGGAATDSRGIDNQDNSNPITTNNIIVAGDGGLGVTTNYGIANWGGSAPLIQNNVIDGGEATNNRVILCSNSSPLIYNNTIFGRNGDLSTYGIMLLGVSAPEIVNNIIYKIEVIGVPSDIAIWDNDAGSDPAVVRNNDIFDYTSGVYYDGDTLNTYPFVVAMEAALAFAFDNIDEDLSACLDPDDDFRFGSGCDLGLVVFDTSGLDGSGEGWDVDTDMDGVLRTVLWSIGAYEYD
ncbi:MAG: Ig-like domain-containing protein [Pseudomonadota bacterium]